MEIYSNFLYLVRTAEWFLAGCITPIAPSHSLRPGCMERVPCKLLPVLQTLVAEELKSSGEDSRENPQRGLACLVSDPPSSLFSFLSLRCFLLEGGHDGWYSRSRLISKRTTLWSWQG